MKKWLYVLSVGGLLAIFLAIYFPAVKETRMREAARQRELQREKDAQEAHQRQIEAQAKADADRRAAEHAREEAEAAAKADKDWHDKMDHYKGLQDQDNADIARYKHQVADLESQLDALNRKKDEDNREDFDLAKQVQLARVEEFDAELDIQRMVDMVATRADQSSFANPPPPPASN